jgi:DNA-binding MarR family transcriptional regulator
MPDDTPRNGSLLREVTRLYVRAQRAAADCCGTSPTQCQVITELGRSGAIPMGELGRRLCLEKSWISRAIDRLVDEGLVAKAANPEDSRSWLVSLTVSGRARLKALDRQIEAHADRIMQRIPAAQRAGTQQSLLLLLAALRDEAGFDAGTPSCCLPQRNDRGAKHATSE